RNLLRTLCQPSVGGNDTKLNLPGKRLFPDLVPSLVKLSLILFDPFFRRVMRRVRGAGRIVKEPWLSRRECLLHPHPVDRFVRKIMVEDIIRLSKIGLDGPRVLVQSRVPLVAVAPKESIKIFEAKAAWP